MDFPRSIILSYSVVFVLSSLASGRDMALNQSRLSVFAHILITPFHDRSLDKSLGRLLGTFLERLSASIFRLQRATKGIAK